MKIKRVLFILSLIALFCGCYYVMNQHYDELARYPYELSQEERTLVLEHLDAEGINYLVTQKIEPSQFLPFIKEEAFDVTNTLWYTKALQTRKEDSAYIVNFINKYKDHMEYGQLQDILKNYSYNVLTRFYDEGYLDNANSTLLPDPTDQFTRIGKNQTVYTYEPSNLSVISGLPHDNIVEHANDIMIKKEVLQPLKELMEAAKEINQKKYGDMTLIAGYLSYEDQIAILESMQKTYSKDFSTHWDLPGQSEFQLGYSISLKPNEAKANKNAVSEEEKEQASWLKENAYKYGFTVRYPKQKENVTGKAYQPYTLRYVGKEAAKKMHDENKTMEEMDFMAFMK